MSTQDVLQTVEPLLAPPDSGAAAPSNDKISARNKGVVAKRLGFADGLGVSNKGVEKLHSLTRKVRKQRTALSKIASARKAVADAQSRPKSVNSAITACTKLMACIDDVTNKVEAADELVDHYEAALAELKRLRELRLQYQRPKVLASDTLGNRVTFWTKR